NQPNKESVFAAPEAGWKSARTTLGESPRHGPPDVFQESVKKHEGRLPAVPLMVKNWMSVGGRIVGVG
ncbi:hypothetical protein, partial [Candidatus Frankia alpina]|uniref:hypothetical protein n=1 Tax=Candidatus Frankia alpina TaxID=2699483 RepID=UPI001F44EB0D